MSEHDRLRAAIGSVLVNASNYPAKVSSRILGQDMGPLIERTVTAVLQATQPRMIASLADLQALPHSAVVVDVDNSAYQADGRGRWYADGRSYDSCQIDLPVRLIFEPEVKK